MAGLTGLNSDPPLLTGIEMAVGRALQRSVCDKPRPGHTRELGFAAISPSRLFPANNQPSDGRSSRIKEYLQPIAVIDYPSGNN